MQNAATVVADDKKAVEQPKVIVGTVGFSATIRKIKSRIFF
jgi:RNase P/RNase MRP subunit POP5